MTSGISRAGDEAVRQFCEMTGAQREPKSSPDGDAKLAGHFIEIKHASTNTLNQVRAVKYIPLAAFDVRSNQWYIIPANEIVRLVANRSRGQHTENPFESETLSLSALKDYRVSDPNRLRQATIAAIEQGDRWPELRQAMGDIRERASSLAKESLAKVRRILAKGPSMPAL